MNVIANVFTVAVWRRDGMHYDAHYERWSTHRPKPKHFAIYYETRLLPTSKPLNSERIIAAFDSSTLGGKVGQISAASLCSSFLMTCILTDLLFLVRTTGLPVHTASQRRNTEAFRGCNVPIQSTLRFHTKTGSLGRFLEGTMADVCTRLKRCPRESLRRFSHQAGFSTSFTIRPRILDIALFTNVAQWHLFTEQATSTTDNMQRSTQITPGVGRLSLQRMMCTQYVQLETKYCPITVIAFCSHPPMICG
jgi:hypothetical protein